MEKENSLKKSEEPIVSFHTRSFLSGGTISNIAVVTVLSLSIMFVLISLATPFWLVFGVFLVSIYALIQFRSGRARYDVYPWGFVQKITPALKSRRPVIRRFEWPDITSYQTGIDMNRSRQEYNYLKLSLRIAPGRIELNDSRADMAAFLEFRDQLVKLIEDYNSEEIAHALPAKDSSYSSARSVEPKIKHKPDFYKTLSARIITILLLLFTAAAVLFVIMQGGAVRATNLFRIFVILVPGTGYMVWRVFWLKGN